MMSSAARGARNGASGGPRRPLAWLCLTAVLANLLAPLILLSAASAASADSVFICHAPAADDEREGSSGNRDALLPHCGLCVLLGGALIAAPVMAAASVPLVFETIGWRLPATAAAPPVALWLHPGSRAPPARV